MHPLEVIENPLIARYIYKSNEVQVKLIDVVVSFWRGSSVGRAPD